MDGSSAKKSASFETLVIQNISNVNDLKTKLNDIITAGKSYEYDVSSCLKSLIRSGDTDIVLLTIKAVAELAKCDDKREAYTNKEIIEPILNILSKEMITDSLELVKQCCRALGNLLCDSETSRNIVLELNGIPIMVSVLEKSFEIKTAISEEIKLFSSKVLLNFAIGGQRFCESIVQSGIIPLALRMINTELEKEDNMNDDMVCSALLILSVINEHQPEILYEPEVNTAVLNVLKETTNVEISELCLDHLHSQAEHDSVKILLANEKAIQLVCRRLELLVQKYELGEVDANDADVETVLKAACDLIIIVLTGDESMHTLYEKGHGEIYTMVVKWLECSHYHLLTTAVLAIGNFGRQDDYCIKMMEDGIFDKLLDIFERFHSMGLNLRRDPDGQHHIDQPTVIKIQHAVLSALRNLIVPVENKKEAARQGRAARILLDAMPDVEDHHVAYKLLAAIRMLVDGQVGVATQLSRHPGALAAVAQWGHAGEYAGAAGEAPRLLAWSIRTLHHTPHWRYFIQTDGCISCLINMLVVCHSLMQNEAILALTLLAIEALQAQPEANFDYEKSFIAQVTKAEIGKHVTVLIDTNCAKMPLEVAENLLAFLDITSKKNKIAFDYKEAKVHESLQKFLDSRKDLSDDLKACILHVITTISDNNELMDVE